MNVRLVAVTLAAGVAIAVWRRLAITAARDHTCRRCRHYVNTHEHLRRGTECSVPNCRCARYRPTRALDIAARRAAAAFDAVLGWLADAASAWVSASVEARGCSFCHGPRELPRSRYCLACVIEGHVPSDVAR